MFLQLRTTRVLAVSCPLVPRLVFSLLYFSLYLRLGKQQSSTPQPFAVSAIRSLSIACAMFDIAAAASFREVYAQLIYPAIQQVYDKLKLLPSTRMTAKQTEKEKKDKTAYKSNTDIIHYKLCGVMSDVRDSGERRNTYMNLAWTGPVENTRLHTNAAYQKVANMAADMFCDASSKAASAGGAAASSTAASAKGDGTETPSQPQPYRLHTMARRRAHPWKIPSIVERGFEIPICITDTSAVPELGNFIRLGMDPIVNAVWLAFYWATTEGSVDAVSDLTRLILDWPMDFIFIKGTTPDEIHENMFKWSVNMCAKVERLRDFVGLETSNMMRIVSTAADIIKKQTCQRQEGECGNRSQVAGGERTLGRVSLPRRPNSGEAHSKLGRISEGLKGFVNH